MLTDPDASVAGRMPGLPDDAFDNDGLVTKRYIRAAALAQLRPRPGELLWDIGAGAGSIVIEWCRADAANRGWAVESRAERAARCRGNIERLTMPGQIDLVEDIAANAIALWRAQGEHPNAVFIGGGASAEVIDACWESLVAGGRIVVHSVTMETEQLMIGAYARYGGELSRIHTETADTIGRLHGWQPARAIVAWAATKHG